MTTNFNRYERAINEINRMLGDLKSATSYDEASMVDSFIRGFIYGQMKQEILIEEEFESIIYYLDNLDSIKPSFLIITDDFDEELQKYADNMVIPNKESFFKKIFKFLKK